MYLTKDMEPTEPITISEEVDILEMFLLDRYETDDDLTTSGEILIRVID